MQISISERLKPFTHIPGTSLLLPCSILCFEIFPAAIRVYDLSGKIKKFIKEYTLPIKGPVEKFTVQQDLENGYLKVWGEAAQGYFRYRIQASDSHFVIIPEKFPEGSNLFENFPVAEKQQTNLPQIESLSFGNSKAQDWTMVHKRQELGEILPFWFRLAQYIPYSQESDVPPVGTLQLLHFAEQAINDNNPEELSRQLQKLYMAGFEGMLSPQLEDSLRQGFDLPIINDAALLSPLHVLARGAKIIKRMIVDQKDTHIRILPNLPKEFHCGRMLKASIAPFGNLDLEWSKKTIRRMIFTPKISEKLQFIFPKDVKSFRLQRRSDGSTQFKNCDEPIDFSSTDLYQFDNFKR